MMPWNTCTLPTTWSKRQLPHVRLYANVYARNCKLPVPALYNQLVWHSELLSLVSSLLDVPVLYAGMGTGTGTGSVPNASTRAPRHDPAALPCIPLSPPASQFSRSNVISLPRLFLFLPSLPPPRRYLHLNPAAVEMDISRANFAEHLPEIIKSIEKSVCGLCCSHPITSLAI